MSDRRSCLSILVLITWLLPARGGALVPLQQPPTRAPAHSSHRQREAANPSREAHFTIEPFLQDVRPDGVVVVWETDVTTSGMVRLDLPGNRAAFLSTPSSHHEVLVSGLRPGTRYHYVVAIRAESGPETRSLPAEFITAPGSALDPFTFLVYGDNRDRDADHAAVIRAMLPEHADLVLQTGDMTGNAGEDILWRRYFSVASPLLRGVPMYPALGNHELRGDPEATHFHRYFVLPGGEDPRAKAVYYSFRYGNTLFVALDGNAPNDGPQGQWLERTLSRGSLDQSIRHVFVFVHQPPYAVGAYCGSEREQHRFVPLFTRYGVRAVFGGHEHAYQHLERNGIRYFVSGGGGAPLYMSAKPCSDTDQQALRIVRPEHHYLRVRIRGDEALLTALGKTGQVLDQVPLHQPIPPRLEPAPKVAHRTGETPPDELMGDSVLALPVSLAAGVAVGTAGLWLARRWLPRRRRDLLPGGEPPPRGRDFRE